MLATTLIVVVLVALGSYGGYILTGEISSNIGQYCVPGPLMPPRVFLWAILALPIGSAMVWQAGMGGILALDMGLKPGPPLVTVMILAGLSGAGFALNSYYEGRKFAL